MRSIILIAAPLINIALVVWVGMGPPLTPLMHVILIPLGLLNIWYGGVLGEAYYEWECKRRRAKFLTRTKTKDNQDI